MANRIAAIILAAGAGSRLRPLTDLVPKCLVPVAGRPLLDHVTDLLAGAGLRDVRISTHALRAQVREAIDQVNGRGGVHLVESFEPTPLGTAGTIAAHADLADDADAIVILYADLASTVDLGRMLAFHLAHGAPITLLRPPGDPSAFGGIAVVDADAYRAMAARGATDLESEVWPRFADRTRGYPADGFHVAIGTFSTLERARRLAFRFRPRLDPAGRTPAVFFDRDGTLIEHVHYLADPDRVRLLPGAAETLRRLGAAGFARVVVTNQSAIGRGIITEARLDEIHDEMHRQLAAEGAEVDAVYFCPIAPASDDRTLIEHPDRKPGPGMLLRAADEMDLDLGASWMVGDLISDVLTGINARCRGSILLRTGREEADEAREGPSYHVAEDLRAVADRILQNVSPDASPGGDR